ncbi:MAG: 1-(5-phosphoribosyl)-5-[(5-phosphoribosylamino)methylideneamino]imidazole-4-carboxamide isomerase [Defluviicoccus sp.]
MIFFPAIDLKEGRCVRLRQGEMASATVFNDDPAAQAACFAAAGCSWLHVVDLDGAFAGRPMNAAAVNAILAAVRMPVQLGGGIRDLATIEAWLTRGVARVIIGTAAVRTPSLVAEACRAFPGQIAVGIDARAGRVATDGWAAATDVTPLDLARRFEDLNVATLIVTDIGRDGVLNGPDLEGTLAIADAVRTPVILSGGISSLADLEQVKEAGASRIHGVICGRALYDGRIDAKSAVRLLEGESTAAAGAGLPC